MVCRSVVPSNKYVVVSPSCFLEWGYPGCYITLERPNTVCSGASSVCICVYSAVYPPQISGFPTTVQGVYFLSIQLQTAYGPIRLVVNRVGMMFKYPAGLLVKLTYVRKLSITSECSCQTHHVAAHHIILSLVYSRKKLLTTSHLRWLIMFLLLAITVYAVYSMDHTYMYIYMLLFVVGVRMTTYWPAKSS